MFKAYTIAAALEKGIPMSKKFNARSPFNFPGRRFETPYSVRKPVLSTAGGSCGTSVGHSKTDLHMLEVIQSSASINPIQLELAAGMCRVTKKIKKVGVRVGTPSRDLVEHYQD